MAWIIISFQRKILSKNNKNKNLILWDSPDEPNSFDSDLYSWNGYKENRGIKSILRYVDENGKELRKSYVTWIYELGQCDLNQKKVVDYFSIDNVINLWWLTSFVEKSPWKNPSINDNIRLLAIEKLITNGSYSSFELVSANPKLHKILKRLCRELNVAYKWNRLNYNFLKLTSLRYYFELLPHFLQGFISIIIHSIRNWPLKTSKVNGWRSGNKSLLMCSQFSHLDLKSCQSGVFRSHLWGELPEFLIIKGYQVNYIHHFLRGNQGIKAREAVNLVNNFNQHVGDVNFHSFLYSFLTLSLVFKVFKVLIQFNFKRLQFLNIDKLFNPEKSLLNLWPIMKVNWNSDLYGKGLVMNYLWILLFDKAIEEIPHQEFGLFICENQPWEKALIYAWKKYNHGRLIGVAHSTIRFWDLRYFIDSRSYLDTQDYPCPKQDITVLNGNMAIQALSEFEALDESIKECEAVRYSSLIKLNDNLMKVTNHSSHINVLVLGDYSSKSTLNMLQILQNISSNFKEQYQFTLKPHPNFVVKLSDFPILSKINTRPLIEIMNEFDVALSGNLTSASVDAHLFGLPVIIAFDDETLNFSPLRGLSEIPFICSSKELEDSLIGLKNKTITYPKQEDFFCLSKDFSKWSQLISLQK